MPDRQQEITALLRRSRTDSQAREDVYRLVHDDLRRIASYRIASARPGQTLSVTSLVNEAYVKLAKRTGSAWNDRAHFLRVASKAMRQITVDHVRARLADKRGAGQTPLPLDNLELPAAQRSEMVIALEQGLEELAQTQPRLVGVVECRFFAGLTLPETAEAMDMSASTVERDWRAARSWLKQYLTEKP